MIKELHVSLFDMVLCLSNALDLISPQLVNHHKRVSYIAFQIGSELELSNEELNELLLAGLLHDIGALSLKERLELLDFEEKASFNHAQSGYHLIKDFTPLFQAASIIRYHHLPWNEGRGITSNDKMVPLTSHILHLADRIEVLINFEENVVGQAKEILRNITSHSNTKFVPHLIEAFGELAAKEYFWLDTISPPINQIINQLGLLKVELDMKILHDLANMFCQIIDFRSPFTATHSSGVAASAETLARFCGFSKRECLTMRIAGYFHDLGKLVIPIEILDKPAKLNKNEINIIKSHTFYTYRILETINELETINTWGSFHHEKLDGSGYPFHHNHHDLSLGSQIMAVADVFTAITEDRPYRKGMDKNSVLSTLDLINKGKTLNPMVISLLKNNYEDLDSIRRNVQTIATEKYQKFRNYSDRANANSHAK